MWLIVVGIIGLIWSSPRCYTFSFSMYQWVQFGLVGSSLTCFSLMLGFANSAGVVSNGFLAELKDFNPIAALFNIGSDDTYEVMEINLTPWDISGAEGVTGAHRAGFCLWFGVALLLGFGLVKLIGCMNKVTAPLAHALNRGPGPF